MGGQTGPHEHNAHPAAVQKTGKELREPMWVGFLDIFLSEKRKVQGAFIVC